MIGLRYVALTTVVSVTFLIITFCTAAGLGAGLFIAAVEMALGLYFAKDRKGSSWQADLADLIITTEVESGHAIESGVKVYLLQSDLAVVGTANQTRPHLSTAATNTSVSRTLEQSQEISAPNPVPLESIMQNQPPTSDQARIEADDGVHRTVTQARGGVRRGVIKVLGISTLLAVIAMAAVWYFSARPVGPSTSPSAAPAQMPQPTALASRAWDLRHLGANGLEKCKAFRLVLKHTTAAQAVGGGSISAGQVNRLQTELNTAKQMPPVLLTPFQCGVPL